MRKWIWLGIGFLSALVVMAGFVYLNPYQLRGAVIEDPQPAPEISLPSSNGEPFVLSQQQGRLVYLFFGYTSCPDVCPITLSEMKQLRASLGDKADQVEFLFVTVDPQRDTVERLHTYLGAFDPQIIGLTGSMEELQSVWDAYGIVREVQDQGSAAGYLVSHSSRTYLIDRQGRLRVSYAFGTLSQDIESDIRYLLKEG